MDDLAVLDIGKTNVKLSVATEEGSHRRNCLHGATTRC